MDLADKGLNESARVIEEAQTDIRVAVRDGWMQGHTKRAIDKNVQTIIRNALRNIRIEVLRNAAYRSLNAFAERQYNTYIRFFGVDSTLLMALMILSDDKSSAGQQTKAVRVLKEKTSYETDSMGIPVQEYAKEYMEKRVAPVIDTLCKQTALDPDDVSGRNSMRNRAEMEVRYNGHMEQIADLKSAGVKLVTCSVHADCSDRCYRWQGRVYSLDGTSGTTEDGKAYVPLETATDVYYTTKAGKTYKNGLLGFNCRHYLIPYKSGMIIPHVSKKTQKKQNAVNTRQREL